jgi:hypothetical protein
MPRTPSPTFIGFFRRKPRACWLRICREQTPEDCWQRLLALYGAAGGSLVVLPVGEEPYLETGSGTGDQGPGEEGTASA